MRIGRFKVESLQSRREAAAASFTLKLLNGDGRGVLKGFVPEIDNIPAGRLRHSVLGLQLVSWAKFNSLNIYKRSYLGSIHEIWSKLPQDMLNIGYDHDWTKITGACKRFLTGKTVDVAAIRLRWEPANEDPCSELEHSDAFMIACGFYYENGMWIAYDKIEIKV
jgi:hypothetical protein